MSQHTFSLEFNFKKCPMCHSRNILKKQVNMICKDCLAQFVRRVDPFAKESLTCVWNRKTNGKLFYPNDANVFIVPECSEKVQFT